MEADDRKLDDELQKMKDILQKKGLQPVFFIGSGLSKRYLESPNWEGLLKKIAEEVKLDYEKLDKMCNGQYEEIAQELEYYYFRSIGDEEAKDGHRVNFRSFIAGIFSKLIEDYKKGNKLDKKGGESTENLKNEISELQKIRPKAIITTNYDTLLEDIIFCNKCSKHIGQKGFLHDFSEREHKISLYKIHGCTNNPESIIITKEDYDNFFQKSRYLYSKILTLFWEYPVIFLGYSVSDRNIKDILALMIEIMTEEQKVEFLKHIWIVDYANYGDECVKDKEIELLNGKKIKIPCFFLSDYLRFYETINKVVLSQRFGQLNFTISENVIELLIEPLYQQQDKLKVVVRELLQNALDACKKKHVQAEIKIMIGENQEDTYLEIQDNGIGMDLQEIKENFLTVGKTNKKNNCEGLVGKYGIGILSIFLIGTCAEVYTKKTQGELLSFKIYMEDNKKKVQWIEAEKNIEDESSFTHIKIYLSENAIKKQIGLKMLGLDPYVTKSENSIILDLMGKKYKIYKIEENKCFLEDLEGLKVYKKLEDNDGDEIDSLLKDMKGLILYNDMISSVVYEKGEYNQLSHIDIPFVILDVKKADEVEEDVKTSLSRSVLQISGRIMEKIAELIYKDEIDKVIDLISNKTSDSEKDEIDQFDLLKDIVSNSEIMKKNVDIFINDGKLFCSKVSTWSHIKVCGEEELARKFYKTFSDKPLLYTEEQMSKTDISGIIEDNFLICVSEKYLEKYLFSATNQHNGLKKSALIKILDFLGENIIEKDMTMKGIWEKIIEERVRLRKKYQEKASNGILWIKESYKNKELKANDDYFVIYESKTVNRSLDGIFYKIFKNAIKEKSVENIFDIYER